MIVFNDFFSRSINGKNTSRNAFWKGGVFLFFFQSQKCGIFCQRCGKKWNPPPPQATFAKGWPKPPGVPPTCGKIRFKMPHFATPNPPPPRATFVTFTPPPLSGMWQMWQNVAIQVGWPQLALWPALPNFAFRCGQSRLRRLIQILVPSLHAETFGPQETSAVNVPTGLSGAHGQFQKWPENFAVGSAA